MVVVVVVCVVVVVGGRGGPWFKKFALNFCLCLSVHKLFLFRLTPPVYI